jgi:uncharacterized protein
MIATASRTAVVNEITQVVRTACTQDSNVFGYGIWTHHIVPVVQYSKILARINSADEEIVEIAALLHDYAGVKDVAMYPEHHIYGSLEAEQLLQQLRYPQDRIDAVKHCIVTHRASVAAHRMSIEAQCLADADAMAHITQVPSLMRMVYVERGLDIDAGTRWVRAKLQRSWHKLSPEAQMMIREQYEAVLKTLTVATSDAA